MNNFWGCFIFCFVWTATSAHGAGEGTPCPPPGKPSQPPSSSSSPWIASFLKHSEWTSSSCIPSFIPAGPLWWRIFRGIVVFLSPVEFWRIRYQRHPAVGFAGQAALGGVFFLLRFLWFAQGERERRVWGGGLSPFYFYFFFFSSQNLFGFYFSVQ